MITFLGTDVTIGISNSTVTVPGDLHVLGTCEAVDLNVYGSVEIADEVNIYGTTTIGTSGTSKNLTVHGTLNVVDYNVSGNTQLNDLNASGDSILVGNVTVGTTTFVKDLFVYGDITASDEITATNQISTSSLNATTTVTTPNVVLDKLTLSYTTVPTFTSSNIGYIYNCTLATVTIGSAFATIATQSNLTGVFIFNYCVVFEYNAAAGQSISIESPNGEAELASSTNLVCFTSEIGSGVASYNNGTFNVRVKRVIGTASYTIRCSYAKLVRIA